MKNKRLKIYGLAILFVGMAGQVQADKPLPELCKPGISMNSTGVVSEKCLNDLNLGFVDKANDKTQDKINLRASLKESSQQQSIENNVFDTLVAGSVNKIDSDLVLRACTAEEKYRPELINNMVDRLGYSGEKRTAIIESFNEMIYRGNIC